MEQAGLHLGDFAQQLRAVGSYVELVDDALHGLTAGQSLVHALVEQARGANARERAPGRAAAGERFQQIVQAGFHGALALPLDFDGMALADGCAAEGFRVAAAPAIQPAAVRGFKGMHKHGLRVLRHGSVGRVRHGHVAVEQPQHVAEIRVELRRGGLQRDHRPYLLRSAAMVVSGPWPGSTRVSPGSANSVRSERRSCTPLPP